MPGAQLRNTADITMPTTRICRLQGSQIMPTVPDDDSPSSSWPDLFRPSTSLMLCGFQDVDARDKRGHDESIAQGRWYHAAARTGPAREPIIRPGPATARWSI